MSRVIRALQLVITRFVDQLSDVSEMTTLGVPTAHVRGSCGVPEVAA